MLSMNDPRLIFVDGLMWYLETRNWAFEKIKACPVGSHLLDIRMHHYLYFSNLFGGVDLVRDYLRPVGEEAAFHDAVKGGVCRHRLRICETIATCSSSQGL